MLERLLSPAKHERERLAGRRLERRRQRCPVGVGALEQPCFDRQRDLIVAERPRRQRRRMRFAVVPAYVEVGGAAVGRHIRAARLLACAGAEKQRQPIPAAKQRGVTGDLRRIGDQRYAQPLLKCALGLEVAAHGLGRPLLLRDVALVEAGAVQRHQQGRIAALGDQQPRRPAPQLDVHRPRHRGEGVGEAGAGVGFRRRVPAGHADVVLERGQPHRIARGERPAPCVGDAARQPGVCGLADRQHPARVRPQDHASSGSIENITQSTRPPSRPAMPPRSSASRVNPARRAHRLRGLVGDVGGQLQARRRIGAQQPPRQQRQRSGGGAAAARLRRQPVADLRDLGIPSLQAEADRAQQAAVPSIGDGQVELGRLVVSAHVQYGVGGGIGRRDHRDEARHQRVVAAAHDLVDVVHRPRPQGDPLVAQRRVRRPHRPRRSAAART